MSRGEITKSLDGVNRAMEQVLLSSLDRAVDLCSDAATIFFVGRGPFYAVALERALKMKEISYIHAEGYAAGEIKHGPFALLSPKTPAVGLCLPGDIYSVMVSNLREMKARGVPLIVIGQEGDLDLGAGGCIHPPPRRGHSPAHLRRDRCIAAACVQHGSQARAGDRHSPATWQKVSQWSNKER